MINQARSITIDRHIISATVDIIHPHLAQKLLTLWHGFVPGQLKDQHHVRFKESLIIAYHGIYYDLSEPMITDLDDLTSPISDPNSIQVGDGRTIHESLVIHCSTGKYTIVNQKGYDKDRDNPFPPQPNKPKPVPTWLTGKGFDQATIDKLTKNLPKDHTWHNDPMVNAAIDLYTDTP